MPEVRDYVPHIDKTDDNGLGSTLMYGFCVTLMDSENNPKKLHKKTGFFGDSLDDPQIQTLGFELARQDGQKYVQDAKAKGISVGENFVFIYSIDERKAIYNVL